MTIGPLRFIQGALLALPNMVLPIVGQIPHMTWAVLAAFSIAIYQPTFRKEDWLYFLFALGVICNAALGIALTGTFPDTLLLNNGFVGGLLLIATYLTARTLNDAAWKIVLLFIAIEAMAIYAQIALGLRFFFPAQQMITANAEFEFTQNIDGESLWYLIRPQGFSTTSTIAGAKMLIGLLLIHMLSFSRRWRWALTIFLLGALLLNFKRSGIISAGIFLGTIFILDVVERGWKNQHTAAVFAIISLTIFAMGTIVSQLTREATETLSGLSIDLILNQLSGRADLWGESWNFISNNLLFGNFSQRYLVESGGYPHNSLLTLLSTHGLFLTTLIIGFYASCIVRKPYVLILLTPLFFDSLFQEHIFWYISMIDIFVLYLLITCEAPLCELSSRWPSK